MLLQIEQSDSFRNE